MKNQLRNDSQTIVGAMFKQIRASRLVQQQLSLDGDILRFQKEQIDLAKFRNIYVLGAGKCAASMASGVEKILGERIKDGAVIVPFGYESKLSRIITLKGDHPVPDINSIESTKILLNFLERIEAGDLIIFLLSGGASSLLEAPTPDTTLSDLQKFTKELLHSGNPIADMNRKRSRLSTLKSGKLLEKIHPAACLNLVISDVLGDSPEIIGSGPTYLPKEKINAQKYHWWLLANNRTALDAASASAADLGYNPKIISQDLTGKALDAGMVIANAIRAGKPGDCLLFGGETTVEVKGGGKGGRNQELALAAMLQLKDYKQNYYAVCIGTDGIDGPTEAAGAAFFPGIWRQSQSMTISPETYLNNNDSYAFWSMQRSLIKTGPTNANVLDITIVLIGA